MSDTIRPGGEGEYRGYSDLLDFYHRKCKETPKGVSLKLERGKHLLLQFKNPSTGKRSSKACGEAFTEAGIVRAIEKAHEVKKALLTYATVSDFWDWYDKIILHQNELENNIRTYREIFTEIENEFWSGRNKQTKRKRSKDVPNDVSTFGNYYLIVFNKISDWDKAPTWQSLKTALYSWKQGTKKFRDAYFILKKVASKSHNAESLLKELEGIKYQKVETREKQSISIDEYLKWHEQALIDAIAMRDPNHREARPKWLWVTGMIVLYGLRPTEVAAAVNLDKPYIKDGVVVPAINDPENNTLLLVLGDFTYFGTSIKTGGRVCKPVTTDSKILELLGIKQIKLPEYKPKAGSKARSICEGFNGNHRDRLLSMKCPVTQAYAFRHLYNQLGEQYGIPQEIRARSMGHSVAMNDTVYKSRSNLKTTVDLLTKHSKQPLSLEVAKQELERLGFDLKDSSIQAVLRVIYQLD